MKLLSSLTSPFGRIPRIVILEHGLDVEVQVVNPWKDRSPLEGISPMSKIPVLLLDDKTPIVDSWVITEYLDSLGAEPLLPAEGRARLLMQAGCAICHDALNAGTSVAGPKLLGAPVPDKLEDWLLGKMQDCFEDLQHRLQEGEYGVEGKYTLLDASVTAALGFADFRLGDTVSWRERVPRLGDWYDNVASARKSAAATVPVAS